MKEEVDIVFLDNGMVALTQEDFATLLAANRAGEEENKKLLKLAHKLRIEIESLRLALRKSDPTYVSISPKIEIGVVKRVKMDPYDLISD